MATAQELLDHLGWMQKEPRADYDRAIFQLLQQLVSDIETLKTDACTTAGIDATLSLLDEDEIPADFPVQPINPDDPTAITPATCGTCGLSWDDGIATSWTPTPSGRCPFEYFHTAEDEQV